MNERLPHRLDPSASEALEIAMLIKGLKDPREAADLIDAHVNARLSAERLNHTLDDIPRQIALTKLVGYCVGLCRSDALGDVGEWELRTRIAAVKAAFNWPTDAEQEVAHA